MPSSYHVDNTWNVIEQMKNLVVPDSVFLDLSYGDVEKSTDSTMQKLQVCKEDLVGVNNSHIPTIEDLLGSLKKKMFAVCVKMWNPPYFLEGTHAFVSSSKLCFNVGVIT